MRNVRNRFRQVIPPKRGVVQRDPLGGLFVKDRDGNSYEFPAEMVITLPAGAVIMFRSAGSRLLRILQRLN